MPSNDFTERLQRRLLELGCPKGRAGRLVREMADHREDLKQAALAEGLLEAGAETRADVQLGDPHYLAEQLMVSLRRSSWWGRHSIVTFCLVPILAVPVLWVLALLAQMLVGAGVGYYWYGKKLPEAMKNPAIFHYSALALHCMDYVAVALVTLFFCWWARRLLVGCTWMVIACGICSLYASFIWAKLTPHSWSLGFTLPPPHWISFKSAIPLLIAGVIYVLHRWRTHRSHHPIVT